VTTIGVAIAVPEPWGEQLRTYRADLGDTTAEGIPTHITLMPPFEVDEVDVPSIEEHLAGASAQSAGFRIHLRGTGTFRPVSPVVFVMVAEGISACEQLAFSVRRGPLETDLQFPYHPHVTIAHHQPESKLEQAFVEFEQFDAAFDVNEMWMYLHHAATGWQPTRAFALGGR
jgi:2'-5' RNA ligase